MCYSSCYETDVCTWICTFCEGTLAFLPHPLKRSAGKTNYYKNCTHVHVLCTLHCTQHEVHHIAHIISMHLVV